MYVRPRVHFLCIDIDADIDADTDTDVNTDIEKQPRPHFMWLRVPRAGRWRAGRWD